MSLARRLSNLIRAFLNILVGNIERRNPEALLELEKENLRKTIGQYNEGLTSHAALSERLMSQVRKLENDEEVLTARIKAYIKTGNQAAAGQLALQLQAAQRELEENRSQLKEAEKTYQNLNRAREVMVNEAKAKIEAVRRSIGDLKVKRATAELSETAAGMISKLGGAGDTFNRLQEMVEEEREQAAGRARVAGHSLALSDISLQESEQQALAEQALADFVAREGNHSDAERPALEHSSGNTVQFSTEIIPEKIERPER